jgi:hypothetical protein
VIVAGIIVRRAAHHPQHRDATGVHEPDDQGHRDYEGGRCGGPISTVTLIYIWTYTYLRAPIRHSGRDKPLPAGTELLSNVFDDYLS